jgi:hypothetical protein
MHICIIPDPSNNIRKSTSNTSRIKKSDVNRFIPPVPMVFILYYILADYILIYFLIVIIL